MRLPGNECKRRGGYPERGRERGVIQNSEREGERGTEVIYFRNGKLPGGCGCSDTLMGTHLVEKLVGAALSPPYLFPLLYFLFFLEITDSLCSPKCL